MAHPRPPCIPGLIPQAFEEGSRHQVDPALQVLQRSDVDATGECHFKWQSPGSQGNAYEITAEGTLSVEIDDAGKFVGRGLKVRCSCPDGERQAAASLKRNKIAVCKHAAAALSSVLDEEAVANHTANRHGRIQERQATRERARQEQASASSEQERQMPGERYRIEHGLNAFSDAELRQHLMNSCQTLEGLRSMVALFPAAVMPVPRVRHCLRCDEDYDDRYPNQRICQVGHPEQFIEHAGRHERWDHCFRCEKDFNVPDYIRGRNRPYDGGEWCFEGDHTQDANLIAEENWNADPGDLCH